jgi:non-specific serine/threonine protein kinase
VKFLSVETNLSNAFFISDPPEKPMTPIDLRAPELILRDQIDEKVDIWSFGCLLFELITNAPPFKILRGTRENVDDRYILQMIDMLGPLPKRLSERWTRYSKYFTDLGVQFNSHTEEPKEGLDPLEAKGPEIWEHFEENKPSGLAAEDAEVVVALLRRILQLDPAKRPSASELLKDPWFSE